jgi:TRAP-type C4-dicarboxylate transport system substrate-binding protein
MKRRTFMKAIRMASFGVIILATLFVVSSWRPDTASAADKVYRWKIQSAYPRGDKSMEALNDFAADVKKRTSGHLLISVFADPELVPGEQLLEATKKGTLDMLHALGAMWGGITPVGEVEFGLPYAWIIPGMEKAGFQDSSAELRKFFYESGFVDILRQEYEKQGLYWLDLHTYGPVFTLATKPIQTCQDLKGKKMRMEGSWSTYYDMLGARGTNLSGEEAYMALKLGTLDGSQWDVSCITALKWHEVAPFWLRGTDPEHCVGQILVNAKSWKELPEEYKKAVSDAAEDYWKLLIDTHVDELKMVADLVKEGKVKESWIDKDCQAKFADAAYKLWDDIGARDPAAARAIQLIKNWRAIK